MSIAESKISILECPLCLKTYEDPRILPCQHSVCEKCLSSYIKDIHRHKGDQQTEFPCPVCNKKAKLKEGTLFQKSLTIAALLDSKQLKAKIQKAHAKTKSNARTIGTQTSFDETSIESLDCVKVNDEANDSKKTIEKYGENLERKNKAIAATKTENNDAMNEDKDFQTHVNLDYFGDFTFFYFLTIYLYGNFLSRFCLLYVLFVSDIFLIILSFNFPYLVLLVVTFHFFNQNNMIVVDFLCERQKIARKWFWFFLLINIDWLVCLLISLGMIPISSLFFSFLKTFSDAISEKQSVFTLTVLINDFISRLVSFPNLMTYLNDKLGDLFNAVLDMIL